MIALLLFLFKAFQYFVTIAGLSIVVEILCFNKGTFRIMSSEYGVMFEIPYIGLIDRIKRLFS